MAEPPKENGLNGAHHGANDHAFEQDDEPLPPPPKVIAELCAACMRFVASKYKIALDGEPDTLSLVDQYVRDARDAVKERPESIDLVAPAIGAYLGEVMRQQFGAEWFTDGSYESYRLYFTNVYLSFNPIGMAREALTRDEQEGWHAHFEIDPGDRDLIDERLSIMPDVDEEEYYLPTTRFDVVTVIVSTLRAKAEQMGLGDVRFTRDDYD
ncbi:MAG: hypothetical protein FWD69_00215 [Polyangiaceae bacterium]|nr:hypothetical protein [Polyangiaceae bacterium]